MNRRWIPALIVTSFAVQAAAADPKTATTLDAMPATLETQYALSALPPALRDQATAYVLDPKSGYRVTRKGTSGVECLVERTAWELEDYRNDIYIPLCYDAAGLDGHFKAIKDAAALRAKGLDAAAVKVEIEKGYKNKTYRAPTKAGLSYMIAPVMRTIGPPDLQVHTMPMPHLMFYAPFVTNADLGAKPNLADHASLAWPFIDRQGNDEQSYMIQMVGAAEKEEILRREQPLVDALCAYRDVLCLKQHTH